jgi:hypothetical protein
MAINPITSTRQIMQLTIVGDHGCLDHEVIMDALDHEVITSLGVDASLEISRQTNHTCL